MRTRLITKTILCILGGVTLTLTIACNQKNEENNSESADDAYMAEAYTIQTKINEMNMKRPKTVDGITYERYEIEDKFLIFTQTMEPRKFDFFKEAVYIQNANDKDQYKKDLMKRMQENPDLIEIAALCKNEEIGVSYQYVNKETKETIRFDISPYEL